MHWWQYSLEGVDEEQMWELVSPFYKTKYAKYTRTIEKERLEMYDIVSMYRMETDRVKQMDVAREMHRVEQKLKATTDKPRPLFRHRDRPQ